MLTTEHRPRQHKLQNKYCMTEGNRQIATAVSVVAQIHEERIKNNWKESKIDIATLHKEG